MASSARKYIIDDIVRIPDPGDGIDYATVIAYLDDSKRTEDVTGTGPLYLVNEGNVFTLDGCYEAVYAESELQPLGDPSTNKW